MKVFDLTCELGHRFEGWFASAEQFAAQCESASVRCPLCDSASIRRAPSAPRLGGHASDRETMATATAPTGPQAAGAMLAQLRRMIALSDNVGPRFAEAARRIHYEEEPPRSIRGTATARERRELLDEGIEALAIALPAALADTLQ